MDTAIKNFLQRHPKGKVIDAHFTEVKAVGNGVYEGIVATNSEDRHGEILDIKGLDTKAYMNSNPVVLFGHKYNSLQDIMGKTLSMVKTKTGELKAKFQLSQTSPYAMLADGLMQEGILNALSIGFVPKEIDGDTYTKSEMVEFSLVPVPANAEAVLTARSLGITKDLGKLFQGAVTSDLDTAEEAASWNASEAIERVKAWATNNSGEIDFAKYRSAFYWVDPDSADKQVGYKLPFADVIDGELKAVWRGVATAYGATQAGLDIPDTDKSAVLSQIREYYKKFDKEVPKDLGLYLELATIEKGVSGGDQGTLTELLSDLATIDRLVDAWQARLSAILGVTNPDTNEPGANGNDDPDDDLDQSASGQDAGSASNTVRELDISKLSVDNLLQLALQLKTHAEDIEAKAHAMTSHAANSPAKIHKRRLILKQARQSAVSVDKVAELILTELKTLKKGNQNNE